MKVLVIVAHPTIEKSVVNRAWLGEFQKNPDITKHEIYKQYTE
jgi:putative NADPH-quinone reductase